MGDYRFDETLAVHRLEVFHLDMPFESPLILAKAELPVRSVLLLKWNLRAGDGSRVIAWTEIAPLPGFSRETLNECQVQLDNFIKSTFNNPNKPRTLTTLMAAIKSSSGVLYPSVAFGLEAVRIPLESERTKNSGKNNRDSRDERSHEGGNPDQYSRRCWLLTERDVATKNLAMMSFFAERIKIKVGLGSLARDIERVNALIQNPSFRGKLRLDANRNWSLQQVERISQQVDCSRIEWFEEPLSEPSQYKSWANVCDIGYALDESLYQPCVVTNAASLQSHRGLMGLILKPTLLGLDSVYALSGWATLQGCRSIISSSFESCIGLGLLSHLAAQLGPQDYHGLDTQKYFPNAVQKSIPAGLLRKVAEL